MGLGRSNSLKYLSWVVVSVVGDSRPTPTRSDPPRRDIKPHLQSPLPSARSTDPHTRTPALKRHVSSGSTSSSEYSSASQSADVSSRDARAKSGAASKLRRRRSGDRSEGGSDRRRLAIVQIDTESTRKSSSSQPHGNGNLRSRRGLHSNLAGLALVAPPDAAYNSYTHLTPPSTAPITGDASNGDIQSGSSRTTREGKGHHKTLSEGLSVNKTSPRDVGIVGTGRLSPTKEAYNGKEPKPNDDLHLPIFQQPHSRSSSPGGVSDVSDPMRNLLSPVLPKLPFKRRSTEDSLIVTPEIGEEKDIAARVAAPVIVSLESARAIQAEKRSPRDASPYPSESAPQIVVQSVPADTSAFGPSDASLYLHYQPGTHATAGPLPPPPRATFSIDVNTPTPPRPPRLNSPNPARARGDIEAVKQALQLPPSVSAVLASRSPKSTITSLDSPSTHNNQSDESSLTSTNSSVLRHVKSFHRREGASTSATTASGHDVSALYENPKEVAPQNSDQSSDSRHAEAEDSLIAEVIAEEVPPITVLQPLDAKGEPEKNEIGHVAFSSASTDRRNLDEISAGSHSSRSPTRSGTPSPPSKSFRNSLTTNLKRFSSLPRTPSLSSRSSKSSSRRLSAGAQPSSRTPSPLEPVQLPLSVPVPFSLPVPRPRPKVKSQYPSAMYCSEVFSRRTPGERCAIYAHKINQLYMYDSGLGDWIIETRIRANTNRPVVVGSHEFTPQPRHTSRASMISEATFPRRPDASVATDLSLKTTDISPTAPPALPYPSLAQSQRFPPRSSSLASATPTSSIRSAGSSTPTSKAGGFFASLGRKTSISSGKREKSGTASPVSSSSSGTKLLTKNPPTNPTPRPVNIPSTPSVPGGPRAPPNRLGRSHTIIASSSPFSSTSSHSNGTLARRPSLFNLSQEPEPVMDIRADPEFVRQVDKLVELIPHADRDVLAGYLRRAGQDILAIGQYLEDEKNGTLKI